VTADQGQCQVNLQHRDLGIDLDVDLDEWERQVGSAVSAARIRLDVERLPAPRSRIHWPARMAAADEVIAGSLGAAGWRAEARPYEFSNVAGFLDHAEGRFPAGGKLKFYKHLAGINVVGTKEGVSSAEVLVVGAHHDTIRDSPGADDNTASVAAMLELGRVLAPYRFERTIMLVAFDMEEIQCFGSRALVAELARERRVAGAIVYESMAYLDPAPYSQSWPRGLGLLYPGLRRKLARRRFAGDWNLVVYRRSSRRLARSFTAALARTAGAGSAFSVCDWGDLPVAGRAARRLVPAAANLVRSDHLAFWRAGLPAILITDTADFRNPHYHMPTDTPDTLDYERLAAIVAATAATLGRHAQVLPA
jgi:hypothetical protein